MVGGPHSSYMFSIADIYAAFASVGIPSLTVEEYSSLLSAVVTEDL